MAWTNSAKKTLKPIRPSPLLSLTTTFEGLFLVAEVAPDVMAEFCAWASVKLHNYGVDKVARNIKVELRVELSNTCRAGDIYFGQIVANDIYTNEHQATAF
jgi:hypothetical protein